MEDYDKKLIKLRENHNRFSNEHKRLEDEITKLEEEQEVLLDLLNDLKLMSDWMVDVDNFAEKMENDLCNMSSLIRLRFKYDKLLSMLRNGEVEGEKNLLQFTNEEYGDITKVFNCVNETYTLAEEEMKDISGGITTVKEILDDMESIETEDEDD